jgi:mannosyl-3-phosphoglycerate phosphatase
MREQQCYIIFSDLDDTLLSHADYSWEEAMPALETVRERGIPLILCSSKTQAEIELYRRRLENEHPFISENGGGIFVPVGYRGFRPSHFDKIQDGYWVVSLGVEYPSLVTALEGIRKRTGLRIKGFSDMSDDEVARLTGLGLDEARLARKRQYDEPFIVEGDAGGLAEAVKAEGLEYTEGGRFFHLMGGVDKGVATVKLTEVYRENCPDVDVVTVGIGDSLNDLPMLKSVDIAVLVKGPGGEHERRVVVDGLIRAEGIGPKGWNDAVLKIITR